MSHVVKRHGLIRNIFNRFAQVRHLNSYVVVNLAEQWGQQAGHSFVGCEGQSLREHLHVLPHTKTVPQLMVDFDHSCLAVPNQGLDLRK